MDCYRFVKFIKIALIIAMICIFCPFIMVSCDSMTVEYSGVELALGMEIGEEQSSVDDDEFPPNVFVIASFVMGVISVIMIFNEYADDNPRFNAVTVCSAIAAICLVLFRFTFVSYYRLQEDAQYLEIKEKWGWIISIVCYLAAAVLAYYTKTIIAQYWEAERLRKNREYAESNPYMQVAPTPPQQTVATPQPHVTPPQTTNAQETTCRGCYKTMPASFSTCPHCGYRMK